MTLASRKDDFPDGGWEVLLHHRLLGEVADLVELQAVSWLDEASRWGLQSKQTTHKCALSRAIFSDDAQITPRFHDKIQATKQQSVAVAQSKIFGSEQ